MVEIDLSSANLGRVAGVDVDALMIANQIVWEPVTADGPYYLNDALSIVPGSFSDGTPNIVTGHLVMFHNSGFVTGWKWYDATSAAGNWVLGFRNVDTVNGHVPISGATKLADKTVAANGSGLRETNFDSPVAVSPGEMYLVTRYSSTGYYVHTNTGWAGSHGAYSDADPVYIGADNENVSDKVFGWTSADRSLFQIGSGDVVPTLTGSGPYYGITPIFYKSL